MFDELRDALKGLLQLLEEGRLEESAASCRFLLNIIDMFDGVELDMGAYMAGALGLPLPAVSEGKDMTTLTSTKQTRGH